MSLYLDGHGEDPEETDEFYRKENGVCGNPLGKGDKCCRQTCSSIKLTLAVARSGGSSIDAQPIKGEIGYYDCREKNEKHW